MLSTAPKGGFECQARPAGGAVAAWDESDSWPGALRLALISDLPVAVSGQYRYLVPLPLPSPEGIV